MAEPVETDRSGDTACHVAEFAMTRAARDAAPWGGDLRPEVLDALREAARWRHFTPHAADVVREIARRHGLPGIAIVFRVKRGEGPPVPPPIRVPFEPIELDENHPALGALLGSEGERFRAQPRRPRPSPWRRIVLRVILPIAGAALATMWFYALLGSALGHTTLGLSLGIMGVLALFLLDSWHKASLGNWFIVPGGVVLRSATIWSRAIRLRRCTPKDTLLLLEPDWPGWHARLQHENGCARQQITDLEFTGLLGAWQCPLQPPDARQLTDLQ